MGIEKNTDFKCNEIKIEPTCLPCFLCTDKLNKIISYTALCRIHSNMDVSTPILGEIA